MTSKGAKKYFTNPVLGLTIAIIYFLIIDFSDNIDLSLIVSIFIGIVYDFANRIYTKTRLGSFLSRLTVLNLILTLLFRFIFKKFDLPIVSYIVIFEIFMVISLVITRLSRNYVETFFWKEQRPIEKALMGEFVETTRLVEYAFTLHVFIVLVYSFFDDVLLIHPGFEIIFYNTIPVLFLIAVIVYQEIKTNTISRQLKKEEWLPIVTEGGEVTGRIARSVSEQMGNHFLHPVIRIVVIHEGNLYLQKRPDDEIVDPRCYDHPLEEYMPYNKEINDAVEEYIHRVLNLETLKTNFLLKYVYENELSKRLIFLFVARIQTQEQLDSLSVLHGKFWTPQQIEEEFVDEKFFSECFQLEYEYLKNTVIESEQLQKMNSI